uniref:Uncharacterized protein n=1 Tax=Setaria digitata TaxID=48799 RepID=A0A915PQ28_9BILA
MEYKDKKEYDRGPLELAVWCMVVSVVRSILPGEGWSMDGWINGWDESGLDERRVQIMESGKSGGIWCW